QDQDLFPTRRSSDLEFDVTTRFSQITEHKFKTEGKVLTAPGWLEVYGRAVIDEDSKDGKALPALKPEDRDQAKTLEATLLEEARSEEHTSELQSLAY